MWIFQQQLSNANGLLGDIAPKISCTFSGFTVSIVFDERILRKPEEPSMSTASTATQAAPAPAPKKPGIVEQQLRRLEGQRIELVDIALTFELKGAT